MKIKVIHNWFIDTEGKVIFRELTILQEILIFFGWGKTEMVIMYSRWIDLMHTYPELTKFLPAFEHENFDLPMGYNHYYKLQGGWKIKKGHEKYLKNGPLFSKDGRTVIVPEAISWKDRWYGSLFGWIVGVCTGVFINFISKILL